jgi:hypothetical protein
MNHILSAWARNIRNRNLDRGRIRKNRRKASQRTAKPRLELLEDRLAPAVYTVNALTDTGTGSGLTGDLRYCINQGNSDPGPGTAITFDAGVFATAKTITLGGTELPVLIHDMTITGPSVGVTVSGAGLSRVFEIGDGSHNPIVTMSNLAVTQGSANGASYPANYGGGIFDRSSGTVTLSNCTLTRNSAGEGGGLYSNGAAVLNNCTISNNTANNGGGLANDYLALTLINCTIAGNSTGSSIFGGGGLFNYQGTATLTNCTLAGNAANGSRGGGILNGGQITLNNTMVAGNSISAVESDIVNSGGTVNGEYDLTGDSSAPGTHSLNNTNPLLAALGNFGGITQTMPLLPGSPAIDAGNNAAASGLTTDQRGFARIVNGTVDIGAFEVQTSYTAPGAQAATEGAPGALALGSFADANPQANSWTVDVTWGDNSSDTVLTTSSQGGLGSATHTFAEEGTYTVTVTVRDGNGDSSRASFQVAVADAALTAGALTPPVATEGQAFSNVTVFHFTDADPNGTASDYTAVVTLGDGNQVTLTSTASANGQIVAHSGGGFDVQLSYTYAEELSGKTFSVSVSDTDGASTSSSSWVAVPSLPAPVQELAVVAGTDGKVYAIGGFNTPGGTVRSVYAYTPGAANWVTVASLPALLQDLAAVCTSDGHIYAIGGYYTSASNSVYVYSLTTGTWATGVSLPTPLASLAAAVGSDGRIYAIGGYDASLGAYSASVYAYTPGASSWVQVASLPAPIGGAAATLGPDGRIYVMGGYNGNVRVNSVYAYTPASNSWAAVASLPLSVVGPAAVSGPDGRIYLLGGSTYQGGNYQNSSAVYAYTPANNSWTATLSMLFARSYFGAAVGSDSRIYAVGGQIAYPSGRTSSVEALPISAARSTASSTATVSVAVVAPKAGLSGPALGVPGQPRTFTFTATHPSQADTQAGFIYNVNWGDGTAQAPDIQTIARTAGNGAGVAADHVYTTAGAYTVSVTATEDGGSTSPAVSQAISVQQVVMEGNSLAVGGTLGNDTITLTPADTTGDITVNLNGTTSFNGVTTFKPTDHILVYGQSGNDTIQLASTKIAGTTFYITVPAFIYGGGTGKEIFSVAGSTANNVVIGGGGTSQITGGLGRDLLIAGLGASKLYAGSAGAILIEGWTNYDLTSTAMTYDKKLAALEAIMAEWGSADSYTTRVNDLTNGGGLNGSYLLNTSTVHDNGQTDTLFGFPAAAPLDWFFASLANLLLIKHQNPGEVTTTI